MVSEARFAALTTAFDTIYSTALSRAALPCLSVVTESRFWSIYRQLEDRLLAKRQPPTSQETTARLRDLLVHATTTVPFYRDRAAQTGFSAAGLRTPADLIDVPPLTKTDLVAHFPDGMLSSRREQGPWRYVATSGTVQRVTVVHDFRKRDAVRAAQLLGLRAATGYRPGLRYVEIPPDICAHTCGTTQTVEPPIFRYALDAVRSGTMRSPEVVSNMRGLIERQMLLRRLELPSLPAGSLSDDPAQLDWYLARLAEARPHVLKALPAYLYFLARRLLEGGGPRPRIAGGIMPMGASMSRGMRAIVERAFGVPVHEDYGSSEMGVFAVECGHRNGLHPLHELFHVEVVRHGQPVGAGTVGRVLITDLTNYAMPLIRYDIGDVAVVHDTPCPCGVSGPRIEVQGRVDDCLVSEGGDIVTPDTLLDALLEVEGLVIFQIEDRGRSGLDLRVVGTDAARTEAGARLEALVGRRVSTRTVTAVLPERSGKYRFVRSASGSAGALL